MRIGIIADVHLGQYWRTNPRRAIKLIDTFAQNLETIRSKTDTLYILGDLFHSVNLPPDCMEYIKRKVLYRINDNCTIVIGNHEVFLDVDNVQKSLPNIVLQEAPKLEIYNNSFSPMSHVNFYALPYHKEMDTTVEYLSTSSNHFSDNSILFGHLTPKEIFERSSVCVTPLIEKMNLSKMFFGDFHEPKRVKVNNCEIYSVGSTYYWDISDVAKKMVKRFLVLDDSTYQVESYPLTLPTIEKYTLTEDSKVEDFLNDKNKIYYFESSIPFDFSQYINDGYDIYFNYLTAEKYSTMVEGITLESSTFVNVDDSWYDYLKVQQVSTDDKIIADKIFKDRATLSLESVLDILGGATTDDGTSNR